MSRLRSISQLLLAAAVVVGAGPCSDSPSQPATLSIAVSQSAMSVVQSQTGNATVTVTRTGFDGDVALSASGAPSGVTISFAPASIASGSTTSTMSLSVAAGAAVGTSTITITAQAAGVAQATTTVALTINAAAVGGFTLALGSPSATVSAGASTNTAVNVTRTPPFSSAVTLTATGAPSGMTVTFNPATIASGTTSSTLSIATTSSTPVGTHTLTVRANATGLTEQTATFTVTVTAPVSTTSFVLNFCAPNIPVFLAYQNEGGAWTRVTPTGGTFTMQVTPRFGLTAVMAYGGTTTTYSWQTYYATTTELAAMNGAPCSGPATGTATVTGTASGLSATETAYIDFGPSWDYATSGKTALTFSGLPTTNLDLVGVRYDASNPDVPNRVIVRQNVSVTNGLVLPALNFGGTEAVAPATAAYTTSSLPAGTEVYGSLMTTDGTWSSLFWGAASASTTVYGVPATLLGPNDVHAVYFDWEDDVNQTFRETVVYQRALAATSVTFGATLSTPTVTQVASSPYVRMRVQLPVQADYGDAMMAEFEQNATYAFLMVTAGYRAGATTWDATLPDLSAVSGWNNAWGLRTGQLTDWYVFGAGGSLAPILGVIPASGATFRIAGRWNAINTDRMTEQTPDGRDLPRGASLMRRVR